MKFTVHSELIWLIGLLGLLIPVAFLNIIVLVSVVFAFFINSFLVFFSFARQITFLSLICNG
jgi:hypothetical protein